MLTIRLQRIGKKNQPYFRVVLIEHARKVGGKYKELLGSYNPRSKETSLKNERITYWMSKGVKPSPTVHNMLVSHSVIAGPKIQAWKPKKSAKKTEEAGAKKSEAAAPSSAPEAKNEAGPVLEGEPVPSDQKEVVSIPNHIPEGKPPEAETPVAS